MSVAGPDIIHEFGLSETQMGAVYSAFLLGYALMMIPGGYLSDRLGPWRTLIGMGFGAAVFTGFTALERVRPRSPDRNRSRIDRDPFSSGRLYGPALSSLRSNECKLVPEHAAGASLGRGGWRCRNWKRAFSITLRLDDSTLWLAQFLLAGRCSHSLAGGGVGLVCERLAVRSSVQSRNGSAVPEQPQEASD